MCFSETVSFYSGVGLIAGGLYAGYKSTKINMRYFPIAMLPIMAGIQQLLEAHVWMGFNNNNPAMIWWSTMGFVFFLWLIWPMWIPFGVYFLEPKESWRKRPLLIFSITGFIYGLSLYIPYIFYPGWIDVVVNKHSIAYNNVLLFDFIMPRVMSYGLYLVLVIAPLLMSSYKHIQRVGYILFVFAGIVYFFLSYAYVSIFCFFAAIMTVHLIYIIATDKCYLKETS